MSADLNFFWRRKDLLLLAASKEDTGDLSQSSISSLQTFSDHVFLLVKRGLALTLNKRVSVFKNYTCIAILIPCVLL